MSNSRWHYALGAVACQQGWLEVLVSLVLVSLVFLEMWEYYLPRWGTSDGTWKCTLNPTYSRWGTRKCNVCAGRFLGKRTLPSQQKWAVAVTNPYLQLPEACSSPNLRNRSQIARPTFCAPSRLSGPASPRPAPETSSA